MFKDEHSGSESTPQQPSPPKKRKKKAAAPSDTHERPAAAEKEAPPPEAGTVAVDLPEGMFLVERILERVYLPGTLLTNQFQPNLHVISQLISRLGVVLLQH